MLAIASIHIYSKNYFVLKDFYTEVLGLKTTYESPENDYLELESGSTKLVVQKSIRDVQNKIRISFKSEDVKAFRKKLQENNAEVSPLKMILGKLAFEMKDPDGNEIAVI
jgi:predicted enzyme related to lactoylglutathione lyase